MMKKENLILTVAFVIMLVVGIVVVTLQNFVPLTAIDTNGVIQYVSMPKDLYGHTQGNFYQISNSHVELLKGVNVNDELPDLVAGTTSQTLTLISNIVEDIMEVAR